MRVWFNGKFINMAINQKVFVGHSGSGHTVFGEYAVLKRTTVQHLVFVTESGATIKTKKDNLHYVVGKAGKQGNFVSPVIDREFIHSDLQVY